MCDFSVILFVLSLYFIYVAFDHINKTNKLLNDFEKELYKLLKEFKR